MTHVLTGRPDSRLDHFSEAGDRVSHSYLITAVGHDRAALCGLRVIVRASGSFSVEFLARPGTTRDAAKDLAAQLSLIDNAKDAVNASRFARDALEVPGKDVAIEGLDVRSVKIEGPIGERVYTLALLENVKEKLRDMRAILDVNPPKETITSTKI